MQCGKDLAELVYGVGRIEAAISETPRWPVTGHVCRAAEDLEMLAPSALSIMVELVPPSLHKASQLNYSRRLVLRNGRRCRRRS